MDDELSESVSPPLPGKIHPPAEMGDVTPTVDDEVRNYHHHPSEAAATEFGFYPDAADAAADLAGDFGSQFLEGATRGENLRDRVANADDRSADEMAFLIEEELGEDASAPARSGEDEEDIEARDPRRVRRLRR